MDTQQIKERLRDSLEMAVLRKYLFIPIPAVLLAILACSGLSRSVSTKDRWIIAAIVCWLVALPIMIVCLTRIFRILRKPEYYFFCRAKLAQPHAGSHRDTMYFTVLLEDPEDGSRFIVNTSPIFYTRAITGPLLEDYINKTVTIAYNRETGMVVVIG